MAIDQPITSAGSSALSIRVKPDGLPVLSARYILSGLAGPSG